MGVATNEPLCGLKPSWSYILLKTFTMNERSDSERIGTIHQMLLLESPDHENAYDGDWSYNDTRWTDDLLNQLPRMIFE